MTDPETMRATRAENYRIKHDAGFSCEGCGQTGSTLAVDVPSEDRSGVFCQPCIPDRRTHRVRPGQWDEAAQRAEEAKRKAA